MHNMQNVQNMQNIQIMQNTQNMQDLQNQAYQIKPTKLNLPNKTYQTNL